MLWGLVCRDLAELTLASTMACISEVLGLAPLGSSTAPANSSARLRVAELTGKLATSPNLPRPSEILTKKSFENAIALLQALGGSTNAVVHLLAIAGRVNGLDLSLDGVLPLEKADCRL